MAPPGTGLLDLTAEAPAGDSTSPIPLVYIVAASHSGSTLLSMLLGSQPQACSVGELKATRLGDVERYRCSCGTLIRECPFWVRVTEAMRRRGVAFDITAAGTDVRIGAPAHLRRVLRPLHRGPVLETVRDALLATSTAWRAHLRRVQVV